MNIRIKGLSADAFTEVNEAFGCGRWYLEKQIEKEDDVLLVNVTVNNEMVILKTHAKNSILLDMGNIKVVINSRDFREVTIV